MDFLELISRFGLALGIGLLFGLERGWRSREEPSGARAAGIRTFAISGLLGGVIGAIGQALGGVAGGVLIGLSFAAYTAGSAVFCFQENRSQKVYSATTWVATILTFALGMYSIFGDIHAAAGLAVAATMLLALREPLHGWVENLTWPELRSALVLLAMTFIALPIMPDGPIGPFGGVAPREIWIIAIVLAGASFVGYVAVKYLGATHGILLAGAAGGLASSTAVTIANVRHRMKDRFASWLPESRWPVRSCSFAFLRSSWRSIHICSFSWRRRCLQPPSRQWFTLWRPPICITAQGQSHPSSSFAIRLPSGR
jgi:hypothetical protein